ncbi:MAG TPA: DUF1648 domain-containing protein [Candidatus Obscuribacterales bacterium]
MLNVNKVRPVLNLPRSGLEKICEVVALAGLVVCLGLFVRYWPQLPETIPTHFNIAGKADDFGSKSVFVIFPVMASLMYLLILVLSRFPHTYNYVWQITEANAPVQYRLARTLMAWAKACSIWLMAVLAWMTARTALGAVDPALPNTLLLSLGLAIVGGMALYFVRAWQAR